MRGVDLDYWFRYSDRFQIFFFFLTKIYSRKYDTDASANLARESWTSEIHIAPIIEYFLNSWERCIRWFESCYDGRCLFLGSFLFFVFCVFSFYSGSLLFNTHSIGC